MIELVIIVLLLGAVLASTYAHGQAEIARDMAIEDSLERKFAASQAVITAVATIVLCLTLAGVFHLIELGEISPVFIAGAIGWLLPLKSDLEDDDWLNGHGQQLKDNLKNLGTRLTASLSPKSL